MMRRIGRIVGWASAVLLVGGCAAPVTGIAQPADPVRPTIVHLSSAGQPASTGVPATRTSPTASSSSGSSDVVGTPVDKQAFYATLLTATKGVTSMTGSMSEHGAHNGLTIERSTTMTAIYRAGVAARLDTQVLKPGLGSRLRYRLRRIGNRMFVGGSDIMSMLGAAAAGKQWALLDKTVQKKLEPFSILFPRELEFQQPDELIEPIRSATSVSRLAPATVNGVCTTSYRAIIDYRAAAALLEGRPTDSQPSGSQQTDPADSDGQLTAFYWIDAHDRVVRSISTLQLSGSGFLSWRYDVTAYNTRLSIPTPDPAAVYNG